MIPSLVLLKRIPALTLFQLEPLFSKHTPLFSNTEAFNVKAFQIKPPLPSIGYTATIITGKKGISKHSVIRNRAKRRIKAVIDDVFPNEAPKGYHYIFYASSPILTLPWTTLQTQLTHVLNDLSKKIDKQKSNPMTIKSSQHVKQKRKKVIPNKS